MKRGGNLARNTPLHSKSRLTARTPLRSHTKPVASRKKPTRTKQPPLKTLRNKADALLTPIIKKMHPSCEACGDPTQVGHHWIEKSRSAYLRYDIRNIIALCHSCHTRIHNRFGNSVTGAFDTATVIIKKRGKKWKNTLDKDSVRYVKVDKDFYTEHYNRLKLIHDAL